MVFARDSGLPAADLTAVASARTAVAGLVGYVSGLAAPGTAQPSPDGKAVEFTASITSQASQGGIDRDAVRAIRTAIAAPAGRAGDGLVAAVTGAATVNADTSGGNAQTELLLTALIVVAIILLIVYRANAGLTVSTLSADILIVLASAGTVTCAMLCLLTADSASLHGLGPVGAVGIVAALIAQITFLPALLLVIGRVAFWPRIPQDGATGREDSRVWAGVAARVARRPLVTAIIVVLLLGAACARRAARHARGAHRSRPGQPANNRRALWWPSRGGRSGRTVAELRVRSG